MQNKKWRVLIVDDEFRIGRLIKKLIHWDEFALECVDVVDNGGTAFEIIQSDRCPDVVITDIRMPKINGLELIAMTREIHKNMNLWSLVDIKNLSMLIRHYNMVWKTIC